MNETKLKIKTIGEPVLRKKAKPVAKVNDECRRILSEMAKTMYDDSGIGLAAPQIGLCAQMIVVDIGEGLYKLINPVITRRRGKQSISEGCLSVPGVSIKVKRAKEVCVQALDETGKPIQIQAQDLFACVLQHEIDHLKGKLIIDYATFLEKIKIKGRIAALKAKAKHKSGSSEEETWKNKIL